MALPKANIRRLLEHVEKETPILCGRYEAGSYFVLDGVADPVILSCYRDPSVLGQQVVYDQIHPDVEKLYHAVADQVPHSGYANALAESTQWDVRKIIRYVVKQKGLLV